MSWPLTRGRYDMCKPSVTFEEMNTYLQGHYKHERLYGRTPATGWPADYATSVVSSHMADLNANGIGYIGHHESATGQAIRYTVDEVKYSPRFFIVGYDSENDIAQKQCYFIDSAINIERARAKCLESTNRYPIVRIKDLQGQFV